MIPDPTEAKTFTDSRIDWSERSEPPHRAVLADTRNLLQIRQQSVVPLTKNDTWARRRPCRARRRRLQMDLCGRLAALRRQCRHR